MDNCTMYSVYCELNKQNQLIHYLIVDSLFIEMYNFLIKL